MSSMPIGSLVRVSRGRTPDEPLGYHIDLSRESDVGGDTQGIVMITRWLPGTSFRRSDGIEVTEFECLWCGHLMISSTYAVTEVVSLSEAK